jgi:uridine phosphorylase
MSNHARGLWGYSGETPEGHPLSITRLAAGVGRGATSRVVTTDLFYHGIPNEAGPAGSRVNDWRKPGAMAVEMGAAALLTVGRRLGVAAAFVLAVSGTFEGGRRQRIKDEALTAAATRMGSIAASALGPQP